MRSFVPHDKGCTMPQTEGEVEQTFGHDYLGISGTLITGCISLLAQLPSFPLHSLPPPTIPAGTKTQTHNLWVTSQTL